MDKLSIFGAGFIGGTYAKTYPNDVLVVPRNKLVSPTNNILYCISTIHNYLPKEGKVYEDIETNLLHFMRVLDNNSDKNDLIFNLVSTWFVYGNSRVPVKEYASCNPKGFYAITARAREELLISYCETYGIKYKIIRLGNVIGIGDNKISLKKNALQYFCKELAHGRNIEIYEKSSIRDYIDVRDVTFAINLILEKGKFGEVYNVSNQDGLYVKDLIYYAQQISGYKDKISEIPISGFHKIVQTDVMYLDNSKIKELGYVQNYSIKDSIKELIEYYKNNE